MRLTRMDERGLLAETSPELETFQRSQGIFTYVDVSIS